MSKEEYDRWRNYIEEQYEKDGTILLPYYVNLLETSLYNQDNEKDEGEDEIEES